MPAIRQDRMNEEVKKTVSEIVREMKDPRLSPMTTITQAEVTNDLRHAKVHVSVYDEDETVRRDSVDALNHAAGFIARELGQRMLIRRLPMLHFELDTSIEYSDHIGKILAQLNIPKEEPDAK
ncbi:MAG: 30S ribosome-binding factor RbfA [Eubacteriales bacterium]|nr:30S ribosome-binding factor RbfA [Eubacteriales bacterium]